MKTDTAFFDIFPPDPPNDGILFVDHSQTGRSGHLGHALVEYSGEDPGLLSGGLGTGFLLLAGFLPQVT